MRQNSRAVPLLNALDEEEKDILCLAWVEPRPASNTWIEKRFVLRLQFSSDTPASLINIRGALEFTQLDGMEAGFLDEDELFWDIKPTKVNVKKIRNAEMIEKRFYIRPKKAFPIPRIEGIVAVNRLQNPALIFKAKVDVEISAGRS